MTQASAAIVASVYAYAFWFLARRAAAGRGRALRVAAAWPIVLAASASLGAVACGTLRGAPFVAAVAGASVCAATDWETGCIFDDVTAGTLLATLAASLLSGTTAAAAGGALVVAGLLAVLHLITRGAGLGLGDVKLGASIGASLGAPDGIVSLGVAFVLGGTYGVALLASRRARCGSIVRFGPFLTAGLICVGLHPCFR
ncbi:MAG TPA: A24 family peptidase [Candidatus Binatia bacterium]|nr:A24 family peptidase [Candidatus Binatia bacterium]